MLRCTSLKSDFANRPPPLCCARPSKSRPSSIQQNEGRPCLADVAPGSARSTRCRNRQNKRFARPVRGAVLVSERKMAAGEKGLPPRSINADADRLLAPGSPLIPAVAAARMLLMRPAAARREMPCRCGCRGPESCGGTGQGPRPGHLSLPSSKP